MNTTEAEQIMKRCQVGTRNYNEANNLHAECYRVIGKLLKTIAELESQEPLGFMNAGQVLEMQQGECHYGYVYPKQKSGASVAIYNHPSQRTEPFFKFRECEDSQAGTATPPREGA